MLSNTNKVMQDHVVLDSLDTVGLFVTERFLLVEGRLSSEMTCRNIHSARARSS